MNRRDRILGVAPVPKGCAWGAALLAIGLLLGGCGQKGPLYLPPGNTAAPAVSPDSLEQPALPQDQLVVPR
ncbi:MAG: LPS translocon maturation chaperone LptM [Hydrogenophaga sp.]